MGWWIFGDDDDTVRDAQNQVWDQAKDYVSKEAARLESEYKAKYSEAEAHFASLDKAVTEKQATLETYSGQITNTIQAFNASGRDASIAAANNGTPVKYSVPTQPKKETGPSPAVLGIAAALAYFLFLKKRR